MISMISFVKSYEYFIGPYVRIHWSMSPYFIGHDLYGPYDMDQIWNLKKTGSIIEEFEISKLLGLSIYMSFMTMLL